MRETRFKQTEVGLIPYAWDLMPLGQLFDFKNGLNKGKEFFGFGTPIVNFTDVFNNPKMYKSTIKGLVSVTSNDIKSCSAHKGDVFFTRTSETPEEVGMSSVLLDDLGSAVFSGFVLRARPKTELLDSEYSGICMRSNCIRRQIINSSTYTTRALTSGSKLSEVLLPLPSLSEQRKIAKALSDIDSLVSSLTKLIEKKQNIKICTMQHRLTGKRRLEGFTEPWIEKEIGAIVNISKGQSLQSKNFVNGNVPVVAGGKVFAGFHNLANHCKTSVTISASGAYAGYVWLHEYPIFASDCSVIEGNDNVDIQFCYYVLKLKQNEIYNAQTGGAQPHIHPKDVEPIKILLPWKDDRPFIDEQIAIANILTDMDKEITILEQKLAKYESIKKGMMQELLTGKIRLV